MGNPIVSIIIPCYNQGHFLQDALKSLAACDADLYELIIVNDGSTDAATNTYLRELSNQGYHVIFQENQGLGAARNTGIRAAKGRYLLPLDADNTIYPAYLTYGINILDQHPDVAVVYGDAQYFGDRTGIWKPGAFNLQRLMLGNFIDACAVIRRSVVEEVGYYDNMKIMGCEDWDLWLRIAFKGHRFHYVEEVLFDYRVNQQSMIRTLNANIAKQNAIEEYFIKKYPEQLDFAFGQQLLLYRIKKKPWRYAKRFFLQKFFPAYYNRLLRDNKMYKGFLYD